MKHFAVIIAALLAGSSLFADTNAPVAFPADPQQILERTCFQTSRPFGPAGDLRADVAICYGIDKTLPDRIATWREHGYRIHVMTGVSWGEYQDYLYGRFDGIDHKDEAQTDRNGQLVGHGGDVYYMCPGTNYGKFLCVGVQRALDAGAEAIHLEEPEFWVKSGYSAGFKREWHAFYNQDWQPPHSSVDAAWRASKLKYYLYRRALQQVFDYIQDYNKRSGRKVRCYVPTHSLINYASWRIVSPESSLARLNGCDGYIAQVWTGTSRTPNVYRGVLKERTFETAFLEYGAMQNLVRSTGRSVWYLNDPIEDNANHDWKDYQGNWESTLVASLFQPDVWHYEVAPWPERIFSGRYPRNAPATQRQTIPPDYAMELQTVMNALNDLKQPKTEWDAGTPGIGVLISDSLMFERGEPNSSDEHLSHIYGMALPLIKRGMPVTPVQLENLTVPHFLDNIRVLMLTYRGMKPLTSDVEIALADWVRAGGALVVCDDDGDPYNHVTDWWNSNGYDLATPREYLFDIMGLTKTKAAAMESGKFVKVGRGFVAWLREDPANIAAHAETETQYIGAAREAVFNIGAKWIENNYLLLRRGPYVIGAGLDESVGGTPKVIHGRFVNLFDSELQVMESVTLEAKTRVFLLDLDAALGGKPGLLASACKALPSKSDERSTSYTVEGVGGTPAIMLLRSLRPPKAILLDGKPIEDFNYAAGQRLLWIRFTNESRPRELVVGF